MAALAAGLLVVAACNGAGTAGSATTAEASPPLTTLPPVTTTAEPPTPTLPPAPLDDICETFAQPQALGTVASAELREVSGIAASRTHEGVLWAHNDSGDAAAVHAIGTDGSDLGRFRLTNAIALDWEDMAIGHGPDPSRDYLYLGDIGDNLQFRSRLQIYRIPEPTPDRAGGVVEDVEVINVTFGEIGSFNAEAMAIDPFLKDLFVITRRDDDRSIVFRVPLSELEPNKTALLEVAAVIRLGEGAEVTAADISRDGGLVALRGFSQVWIWVRDSQDAADVFAGEPCRAPSPDEVQGEALAFDPTGLAYYTLSEGAGAAVNYVGQADS